MESCNQASVKFLWSKSTNHQNSVLIELYKIKQRHLTCNFMYSFSFFFISCSCWVFTCFKTIQESDRQESETYPFWSRVIQTRRPNKQSRSNSNLITNNHSLKLIPLLLQLLNLSLQSCRVFSFLHHRNLTPFEIK